RRVAHRADHGELVIHLRQLRQNFGELHPRKFRVDRLEDATDVVGNVVLRVPQIEVAGPSLQIDQNYALGLGKTGASCPTLFRLPPARKNVSQRQAQDARTADSQQFAAGNETVTVIFAALAGDDEHVWKSPDLPGTHQQTNIPAIPTKCQLAENTIG